MSSDPSYAPMAWQEPFDDVVVDVLSSGNVVVVVVVGCSVLGFSSPFLVMLISAQALKCSCLPQPMAPEPSSHVPQLFAALQVH